MCTENYETSHQTHFKPYETPNGTESIPPTVANQTSGFFRERAVHIPNSFVPPVSVDLSQISPVISDWLNQIGSKDDTTYGSTFVRPARAEPVVLGQVGRKEASGFTSNTEIEPLTGTQGERWHYRSRPVGSTEYKDRFPPYEFPKVETSTSIADQRMEGIV